MELEWSNKYIKNMTNFGMQGICMLGLLRAGGGLLLSTHTAELILYPLSIPKKGKKKEKGG